MGSLGECVLLYLRVKNWLGYRVLKYAAEQSKNPTFWITIWENQRTVNSRQLNFGANQRFMCVCTEAYRKPFQEKENSVSKRLHFHELLGSRAVRTVAFISLNVFSRELSHSADISIYRSVFILTLADGQQLKEWDHRYMNDLKWGFSCGWPRSSWWPLLLLHIKRSHMCGSGCLVRRQKSHKHQRHRSSQHA